MTIEPFVLDHIPNCPSTAYLIHSKGAYVLYFGDTGPDAMTATNCLQTIWTRVAPLIRDKKLQGIFLESSHPNDHPDHLLFGHLTPSWVMAELHRLADLVNPAQPRQALRDLAVVVTHIKPSFERSTMPKKQIAQQLQEMNDIGVRFIIPKRGQRIEF
jgi:3',5'-cyclic-nucleotide phosphodiesterase